MYLLLASILGLIRSNFGVHARSLFHLASVQPYGELEGV